VHVVPLCSIKKGFVLFQSVLAVVLTCVREKKCLPVNDLVCMIGVCAFEHMVLNITRNSGGDSVLQESA